MRVFNIVVFSLIITWVLSVNVHAENPIRKVSPHLVDAGGQSVSSQKLEDKQYVLLFFSAHWCPPCRRFTPKLVDFYRSNGGGDVFEIIFVSSDRSEEAMYEYMKKMKMGWIAVDYNRLEELNLKSLAGPFIPSLVLFDGEGEMLSSSFDERMDDYTGPEAVVLDLAKRLSQSSR